MTHNNHEKNNKKAQQKKDRIILAIVFGGVFLIAAGFAYYLTENLWTALTCLIFYVLTLIFIRRFKAFWGQFVAVVFSLYVAMVTLLFDKQKFTFEKERSENIDSALYISTKSISVLIEENQELRESKAEIERENDSLKIIINRMQNGELYRHTPNSFYPLPIFHSVFGLMEGVVGRLEMTLTKAPVAVDKLSPHLFFYEQNEGVCEMSKWAKVSAILELGERTDTTRLWNSSDKRIDRLYKKYDGEALYHDRYYREYLSYVEMAYRIRGNAYFVLGDLEKAMGDYERAMLIEPESNHSYDLTNIAAIYVAQGLNEEAIELLNDVVEYISSHTYYVLGVAYFNLGQYDIAEENLVKCDIGIGEHKYDALNYMCAINVIQGKYDKAIEGYTSIIDETIEKTYGDMDAKLKAACVYYYNRAVAYLQVGMKEEAQSDYGVYIKYKHEVDDTLPEIQF